MSMGLPEKGVVGGGGWGWVWLQVGLRVVK